MSDKIDHEVLDLISRIIEAHPKDAFLIRRIWSDRQLLVDAMRVLAEKNDPHIASFAADLLEKVYE